MLPIEKHISENFEAKAVIAASLLQRRFLGIDKEEQFLSLSALRRQEIDDAALRADYRERIFAYKGNPLRCAHEAKSPAPYFGAELPID